MLTSVGAGQHHSQGQETVSEFSFPGYEELKYLNR